ncbi:MAG: 2OG-Fe(II) oxygenase [Chitinophagaceae bacterium]
MDQILNNSFQPLSTTAAQYKEQYQSAAPFPNIYFDNFFDPSFLSKVLKEFPDLSQGKNASYNSPTEIKLASKGAERFSSSALQLANFLNSEHFLRFLQELTGIEEALIPDPYFEGGGYHEIKPGGFLKIHADFNKHRLSKLDRRINVLVYLNKDWEESYGGHFELWDEDMKTCRVRIAPLFNRLAIFSTTSNSYHGHPDPLTCPADRSRRSFALYYYTNGRPAAEVKAFEAAHGTLFKARQGMEGDEKMKQFTRTAGFIKNITPPFLFHLIRKIFIKD